MGTVKRHEKRIARRGFLKGAAVGVAGMAAGALSGCASGATPGPAPTPEVIEKEVIKEVTVTPSLPDKWDLEADVVVVGYGGAGSAAAITASDANAKVVILEKLAFGGGNTGVCGGSVFTPSDAEGAVSYFNALDGDLGYPVEPEMVRAWAESMVNNGKWIEGMGGTIAWDPNKGFSPEWPGVPGADSAHTFTMLPPGLPRGRGLHLFQFLQEQVEQRKIEVLFETPASELITNGSGEVVGVLAEGKSGKVAIKANRGVVLACGGFENNKAMLRDYLGLADCRPQGTPSNTGDGIKMAMAVGADLWHMNAVAGLGLGLLAPDADTSVGISSAGDSYIFVARDGTRFTDERITARHGRVESHGEWVKFPTYFPSYVIFDDKKLKAGPLGSIREDFGFSGVKKTVTWSDDNQSELSQGTILKGDTVADLAAAIQVDAGNLEATIARYNAACAAGKDDEFGRSDPLTPLEGPPFYAAPLVPILLNTQGGPKRNPKAQVLDVKGNPIPRLYSAGEMGSIYAYLYNGGGNVGEALAFGRVAGENAAAEEPWS